jgi:hypothetical protein
VQKLKLAEFNIENELRAYFLSRKNFQMIEMAKLNKKFAICQGISAAECGKLNT